MIIKRITKNLVDCFVGAEGWFDHEWVRLRCVNGRWEYVKGNKMLSRFAIHSLIKGGKNA